MDDVDDMDDMDDMDDDDDVRRSDQSRPPLERTYYCIVQVGILVHQYWHRALELQRVKSQVSA